MRWPASVTRSASCRRRSHRRGVGPPLAALKSLDRTHRVICAGTFSKVLHPGLRLGYLAVPEGELQRFKDDCLLLTLGLPPLEQAVTAPAMEQGLALRRAMRTERRAHATFGNGQLPSNMLDASAPARDAYRWIGSRLHQNQVVQREIGDRLEEPRNLRLKLLSILQAQ